VYSSGSRSASNVSAIIHEQARLALERNLRSPDGQLKKNSSAQALFAKLYEGNFGGDGGGNNFQNVFKLFTRRCRLKVRGSARDQINDWLHVSLHFACAVLRPHFPARREACV